MLLVWMHVALHELIPLSGGGGRQASGAQQGPAAGRFPEGWSNAAGRLAAQGTPHAVLAASRLGSAEVNAGEGGVKSECYKTVFLLCDPPCLAIGSSSCEKSTLGLHKPILYKDFF